ncbi:MAG TPA: c-type cytochrome biogenesis protein CcsB, partial [Mycobacteriales bacterium]|nr:c-type cytochrome biogenesis protein CcsB [Mycobacteriales bacterium]
TKSRPLASRRSRPVPVDVPLAHFSDRLIFVTVVLYALAMLGYAAEFAFGRRSQGAAEAAGAEQLQQARVLVGAGGPESSTGGSSSTGPSSTGYGPVLADGTVLDLDAGRPRRPRREGSPRAGTAGIAAVLLTIAGWAVHVGAVVTRGFAAHRVPWGNMYEFSMMITLIVVTGFLLLLTRQPVRYLGAFVMGPVVCYLGVAGTVLYTPAGPLVPALHSYWIVIHVIAVISATGIFALSAVVTTLFLVRDRYESAMAAGRTPGQIASIGRLLPSSASLDTNAFRIVAFGFPVWTFGVIAGAIWAESAWGRYWGWDPKETFSFITWVVYAAYLHARATAGWKGRRAAYISLFAFACLTFDFYGVNLWFAGLHSYQGPGV